MSANRISAPVAALFEQMNLRYAPPAGAGLPTVSPGTGEELARLPLTDMAEADAVIARAQAAFLAWRAVPAPVRGQLVRLYGDLLRTYKEPLARLLSMECGKILTEARGEVQEVIDICEFATGLSRQLHGLSIATERPGHKLLETWHPMGVFGQITAFNFPAAVWAWGTMVALVCGNSAVWKPSEKTPLTALACTLLFERAAAEFGQAPDHLVQLLIGGADLGVLLAEDARIPVLSATGSTRMGRDVAVRVAGRFGRAILELGGNNAAIVTPSADLDLALRGIVFSAAGTAGQRCTTLRRLIVHDSIRDDLVARLKSALGSLVTGDPLDEANHVGPLIDEAAFTAMQAALAAAREQGGTVWGGERAAGPDGCFYVRPALVEMPGQTEIVRAETFAPILYVISYSDFDQAIALQNGVPQGLSSAVFTRDLREAELFQSALGSDCGIANVNIGTSGAEIGGAFGGEKATGGGRASGSDTWKAYMRRATNTINYSNDLPLAQGVKFDIG
ncbi:aldehyde dehydrogenase family protein [Sphingomonas sp. C3-2]|uniref:L-piperidine-6-carboxylate dehydrogenase n=1 Tax=Sphingomonas sp. C3-2 TaxID=3062169 RepID=UPI00294B76A9|nr:aldehyde dehydrogenase family protein [Sphingomonas sp. C3-2]WOK37478.1 aldehyde dehydrogenase family protein [Sphingomonas sp. C3-2]